MNISGGICESNPASGADISTTWGRPPQGMDETQAVMSGNFVQRGGRGASTGVYGYADAMKRKSFTKLSPSYHK